MLFTKYVDEKTFSIVSLSYKYIYLIFRMNYRKNVKTYFEEFNSIYLDNFEACVNIICNPQKYERTQYVCILLIYKLSYILFLLFKITWESF